VNKKNKFAKILERIEFNKELNNAKTQEIQSEYDLIEVKRDNSRLKNEINLDKKIRLSGITLHILSFAGFIATCSLSIAGGYRDYKGLKLYAFIIAILFIQSVVYKVSMSETIIKKKFNSHYFSLKAIQFGLLTVSIYYNWKFFNSPNIITLLLCILLDISYIKFVGLAHDCKLLNFQEKNNYESGNLISMFLFNKLFKLRYKTIQEYSMNKNSLLRLEQEENFGQDAAGPEDEKITVKVLEKDADRIADPQTKLIESAKEPLFEKKVLNLDNLEKVFNYIIETKTGNVAQGIKKIAENTDLKIGEVTRIRDNLIKHGYLQPDKMQTLVVKESLNISDFEEV
jgi:hypothetical protein